MSIFRNTFQQDIRAQLEKRQEAMVTRTPKVIQYLNSRNSWIRLSSSVNVGGSANLAKNNVLLGGALDYQVVNGKDVYALRQGVGQGNEAYSNFTPSGPPHRLGTRPMPGITNMDIKSKSAYGSLREATINFICWDIRQLEDLELLYMRPGYTVLVEWGWLPYLDNKSNLITTLPNFYDILNKGVTNRTTIFKELYDKSTNSGGNYDAMFGYVKNYQWSAREDGGYDCQTTIISTGEIIESLKVNFVLPDLTRLNSSTPNGIGFLDAEFSVQGNFPSNKWKQHYEKNTLAGIWAEAYDKLKDPNSKFSANSIFKDRYTSVSIPSLKSINFNNPNSLTGGSDFQVYITLEAAFDVINKYILPKDSQKHPLMELSLDTEGYSTGVSESLLCVAHPTQVSVDPSVCLIKSPLWYDSGGILYAVSGAAATNPQLKADAIKKAADDYISLYNATKVGANQTNYLVFEAAIKAITNITEYQQINNVLGARNIPFYLSNESISGGVMGLQKSVYTPLQDYLDKTLGLDITVDVNFVSSKTNKIVPTIPAGTPPPPSPTTSLSISSISKAITNLELLKNITQPYFLDKGYGYDELGVIKNIYINLDFLYKQSLDSNLESSDNKEKNEISLYKYLKSIMSAVQTAIGNVSNFEIHVDPIDNKARVIDVNYTGAKSAANLFKLQVHNLNSVVRKYSLQSQIFPEQSAIIAIGSQAKGGQLGMQNNTMIDFNKSITDRIILEKAFPDGKNINDPIDGLTNIASNLGSIIDLFGSLSVPNAKSSTLSSKPNPQSVTSTSGTDLNTLFASSKNNLRDLIVYFQSITNSPGANRNIIPIKFSFEMDGIGGLVIGHLFEINDDILPSGYKGIGTGSKLAQTVTGIGHSIGSGDWTTKIDALNIILGSKSGPSFESLNLQALVEQSFRSAFDPTTIISARPTVASKIASFGSVSTFVPLGARPLLDLIAYTEGTAGVSQNGYDIIVGYRKIDEWNPNYTGNHPDRFIPGLSTAAGRYQFVVGTWNGLGFGAFNQENQDRGGWKLITNTGFTARDATDVFTIAKSQIQNNQINITANPKFLTFLDKTYQIWASLPNSKGQYVDSEQGGAFTKEEVYGIFIEAIKKY
jgi:muramidase (phage lysozyme)